MTVVQGFGPDDTERGDADYDGAEYENSGNDAHEAEAEELTLVEDDEPLPWLESDYDEEEEGVDTGRLIGFVLLSLVVLGLILAVAWWFLRDRPDPDLVPQGETIEAPEGAVKERPEDAGGKQFEGTGNVAPTVGQGITGEGRLASDDAPRPSIDTEQAGSQDSASTGGSVAVQVGAYSSRASASTAWQTLRGQTQALKGFNNRIVEGEVDGGKVFRLQALAGDAAAANSLCNALKADGIACQVKR